MTPDTQQPERNPSTAMAEVLVDELVRNGVRQVVVSPGSRSTALVVAVAARDELTAHVRHDERSAAFLALGMGRATGTPAVVITTSGTAVANLAPAIAEADAAGVALLAVTADRPAELHDVGANQTFRQAGLFGHMVRFASHLCAASDHPDAATTWRSVVCRAVAAATGRVDMVGRSGPVHLNVEFREPTVPGLDDGRRTAQAWTGPLTGRTDRQPWTRFHDLTSQPGRGVIADLANRVAGRRVLVVAGDAAQPMSELGALADQASWPVLAEPTASRSGLAHASLLVAIPGWLGTHRPEVVLRLGRPTLSGPALVDLADVETIQVTAAGLVDPTRTVDHALVVEPATLVSALRAWSPQPAPAGWLDAWRRADRVAAEVVADHLDGVGAPEPAVARRVATATGDRMLVVASSLPIRDVADYASADTPDGRVIANRGLAGIDGFVSTAVGVAVTHGPTVALAGDLSLLHDHNGLLVEDPTAVPLTLVVVDNDGGGLFHHVPASRLPEFERFFATPHGRDLVAMCRAVGLPADEVGVDEIGATVGRKAGGMSVLVVRTDRRAGASARRAIAQDLAVRLASTRA